MSEEAPSTDQVAKRDPRPAVDVRGNLLRQDSQDIDRTIKRDTHNTRQALMVSVGCVAFLWVLFTAVVVLMLGFQYRGFNLSDAVMIAFLTTSLGTVFEGADAEVHDAPPSPPGKCLLALMFSGRDADRRKRHRTKGNE